MLPTQDHAVRITELANHMNPTSLVRDWSRQDKNDPAMVWGRAGTGRTGKTIWKGFFFPPWEKELMGGATPFPPFQHCCVKMWLEPASPVTGLPVAGKHTHQGARRFSLELTVFWFHCAQTEWSWRERLVFLFMLLRTIWWGHCCWTQNSGAEFLPKIYVLCGGVYACVWDSQMNVEGILLPQYSRVCVYKRYY